MFHAVSVFYCNKRVGSPFDDPLPLELDKHKKMLQTIEFAYIANSSTSFSIISAIDNVLSYNRRRDASKERLIEINFGKRRNVEV